MSKAERKQGYFQKISNLFETYTKVFMVDADNVGSFQMQQIRISLRGKAVVLMGKNTMMRKAIRSMMDKNPDLERILPYIVTNVGFVFTNDDLVEVRDIIMANKVPAAARAGGLAPVDVHIEPMVTTLGPEKTSFFQALSIPTKITRGTIEILGAVHLIKQGERCGASECTLLGMLDVKPFFYGLDIRNIYEDGSVFPPSVLDLTSDDVIKKFQSAVKSVAAISLALNYPTICSAPHSLVNGYKKVLAVCLAMEDYCFPLAQEVKDILSDPTKLAALAAAAAAPAAGGAAEPEKKEEAKKEESESDDDMGFGLFD